MKGYIFAVGGDGDVERILHSGLFGTIQRPEIIGWRQENVFLATTADYLTIAPRDKVFFFQNRKIYGIGEVIDIFGTGGLPILLNYPGSLSLRPNPVEDEALVVEEGWEGMRVIVPFVASPVFFNEGIDMDELLASPGAESAWGLRFWDGPSFQQLGVSETRMLLEVFHRRFYGTPNRYMAGKKRQQLTEYLNAKRALPASLINQVRDTPLDFVLDNGQVKRETGLHSLLVEHMRTDGHNWSNIASPPDLVDVFHELAASPPKPPRYADKIDIFSTRETHMAKGLPVHFDIIEAKRDPLLPSRGQTGEAVIQDSLPQIMRYVDFVAANYAGGNYAAVSASYISNSFSDDIKDAFRQAKIGESRLTRTISRSYVLSPRDTNPTNVWNELNLLEYKWDLTGGFLSLRPV